MKKGEKLKERMSKGLFTLVMSAFMLICMGKMEVQAREILPDTIKQGDVLYPGDVIIGAGKVGISIYDVNRKKILHVVDGGNLVIEDSYRWKKISAMKVKEVTSRGSVLLDVELVEPEENLLEAYKSLLNDNARNEYARQMQIKEGPGRVILLDSLKSGDLLYPGDVIVGVEGLKISLQGSGMGGHIDQVIGENLIIKDSYAGKNVFLLRVWNNYNRYPHAVIAVEIMEKEEEYVYTLFPRSKNNYIKDGVIFDADYYAYYNQDVAVVLGDNEEVLYNHYLLYGMQEGRKGYEEQVSRIPLVELATTKLKSAERTPSWDLFEEVFNPIWIEERLRIHPGETEWSYCGSEIGLDDYDHDSQQVYLSSSIHAGINQLQEDPKFPPTFNLQYRYYESFESDGTFDPEGYWKLTLPTYVNQTELSWYAIRNAFRLVTPDAEVLYQQLFNVYYGKPNVFKRFGEWVTVGNSQVKIDQDKRYQVEFFFK